MLKTPFGRYMYAIGNNRDGARMLGIRVDRVRLMVFGAAGAIAGLAGVLMVARLGTAQPSIGDSWVLAQLLLPSLVALPQQVVSVARLARSSVQVSSLLLKTLSFCLVSLPIGRALFRVQSSCWQSRLMPYRAVICAGMPIDQATRLRKLKP